MVQFYDAPDLVAQLGGALAVIGPWVGAGVGAGILLMFAFLGIRSGIRFFQDLSGHRKFLRDAADAAFDAQYAADVEEMYSSGLMDAKSEHDYRGYLENRG
jgi:hypothetical protein